MITKSYIPHIDRGSYAYAYIYIYVCVWCSFCMHVRAFLLLSWSCIRTWGHATHFGYSKHFQMKLLLSPTSFPFHPITRKFARPISSYPRRDLWWLFPGAKWLRCDISVFEAARSTWTCLWGVSGSWSAARWKNSCWSWKTMCGFDGKTTGKWWFNGIQCNLMKFYGILWDVPSDKCLHNSGQSPFWMGTMTMAVLCRFQ